MVVCLVHLVSLVHLVYPVNLVQPNKQDKPNKPIKRDRPDRPNRPHEQDRLADFFSILLTGRNNVAKPAPKSFRASCLHPDGFDHLHVFSGEGKLFSLEIIFHMLRVRGAGQRKHPDLHGKPKDDLCKTGP